VVEVLSIERKSAVLTPSSLACLSRIPTVNLTAGCAHGCTYCYTRAYSTYPGESTVVFYSNTFRKLREELSRKRRKPTAVYFSPSSDVFQPVPEVLNMAYDVFQYLLDRGISIAFLTEGHIPERHMRLLQAHASQVRAQIGLITLDGDLLRTFEPHCPSPETRLAQIRQLAASGIVTQVRLDPILPGLTDDDATLERLCSELKAAGVERIAASTLFLRTGVVYSLKEHIEDQALLGSLLEPFKAGGRIPIHAANSTVFALPPETRRTIYARLQAIAQRQGLAVHVCACKNLELASSSCSIAGDWSDGPAAPRQQALFAESWPSDRARSPTCCSTSPRPNRHTCPESPPLLE
jgi:DNA repair photolyase